MIETQTQLDESMLPALEEDTSIQLEEATKTTFRIWLCDRLHAALLIDLATITTDEGNPYADLPDEQRRLARDVAATVNQ